MGSVADGIDIDGAHAALHVAQPLARGVCFAQKIGHEGLHARHVEHDARRTVADEGDGADIGVPLALVKGEPLLPKLFGCDLHTVFSKFFQSLILAAERAFVNKFWGGFARENVLFAAALSPGEAAGRRPSVEVVPDPVFKRR